MTVPSATYSVQVAIAGGGIVGKAMALGLLQLGLKVALIDPKVNGFHGSSNVLSKTFPRAYALSPGSQALLERLRVWQALDPALLGPVYDMRIYGRYASGSALSKNESSLESVEEVAGYGKPRYEDDENSLHFSAFEARTPVLAWIVQGKCLESALDAALSFQPNLQRFSTRICQIHKTPNAVTLSLDDQQALCAELLLGADGVHSFVRSHMEVRLRRHDYPQLGVIATFQTQKPHGETAYQWFDQGEILALLPLPGNQVSMVWSAKKDHARALLACDGPALAAAVQRKVGDRFGRLDCLTPDFATASFSSSPSCAFPLSRYSVDRLIAPGIALIGDAAHGIHPLAGQGLNLGLADVFTLLDVVAQWQAAPYRSLGELSVLRRYERARREPISKLLWATEGLYRLFSIPGTLAQKVRITGMEWLNRSSFLKRQLVAQALSEQILR